MIADKILATPLAKTLASLKGIDLKCIQGTGIYGEIRARDVEKAKVVTITPLAKRIAEENCIDLDNIQGSGFKGKIRKEDILAVTRASHREKSEIEKDETNKKPLKGMRKIIAERMLKSHLEAPPVTLNTKADVTELTALKNKLREKLNLKVSYNDFVLKAAAIALKEYPNINVSLEKNEILYKNEINIGVAVALDGGLIVPNIKNADVLSLKEISHITRELAAKGREGNLTADEIEDGTFTVSNLGMYDVLSFTPIINPPESAILGVCAIEEQLKRVGDKIEDREMMGLSLTFDHRVIDGADGAIFLRKIKILLENPLEILI